MTSRTGPAADRSWRIRSRASKRSDWVLTLLTGTSSVGRRRAPGSGATGWGAGRIEPIDGTRVVSALRARGPRDASSCRSSGPIPSRMAAAIGAYGRPDAADRDTAAAEDAEAALRGEAGDLAGQPRLADAGLTREEEVGRVVGDAVEDVLGQPDLVGPADEDGTDASSRHSADDRRAGRRPDMDGCHPEPGVSPGPAGRGGGRGGSAPRGDGAPGLPGSAGLGRVGCGPRAGSRRPPGGAPG